MPKQTLTEAKNIGGHAKAKDPWHNHAIIATINAALRPGRQQVHHDVGQRFTYPKYARLESAYRRELGRLFASITSGSSAPPITPPHSAIYGSKRGKASGPKPTVKVGVKVLPSNRKMKAIFRKFYIAAFMLGQESIQGTLKVKIDPEDRRWLETFLRKEFDYWKKFVADLEKGKTKMDPKRRVEMYVQTLHTMYDTSRVLGSSATAIYHWETSPAEHCTHCLYLAAKGPFIKGNLPTIPASGDTACKSNCKCHLRIEHPTALRYHQIARNAPTREELLRGMRALKG